MMKKNCFILLYCIVLSIDLEIKSSSTDTSLNFENKSNCQYDKFEQNTPSLSKNNYLETFNDYKSVPVGQIATNGDYVRTVALYTPEAGTPVNLLPGPIVYAKPVEQVAKNDISNQIINQPVKYNTVPSKSVGRAISEGGYSIFSTNSLDGSLNSYFKSSRDNNRGSLLIDN